ncbi:hypothetical protein GYMLUDRAFT_240279 [Collybiopsis luxurians FD-317 M1]|nr:hypothetical protein GYMLUDRAFT_240279 [Collybiopsis luxurians FD-317 M1]
MSVDLANISCWLFELIVGDDDQVHTFFHFPFPLLSSFAAHHSLFDLPMLTGDVGGTSSPTSRKTAEKAEKARPAAKGGKKDPKAPKRALSAYMFFSQDWRERIKAENPDAGFGEVGKLLGAKWKELDEEEKKPYVEQASRDKARAEEEKNAYDNDKKNGAGSGGSGEEAGGDDDDDE